MPPIAPMLAKPVAKIPDGASYEPKWDGFRSIVFRDGDEVELGSRNEKPLTRYFPELVAAVLAELPPRCVVDGEIVIATEAGLDFEALQQRIHPADSRVRLLAEQTPSSFIAFDLLALGDEDYTGRLLQRAPCRADGSALECRDLDTSDPRHHRSGTGAALVRGIRGRRYRRSHRQTVGHRLPTRQTSDVQDQAGANRRLRGRGLPSAQIG